MSNEDFITYKQALALKELGFTWETNHYYDEERKLVRGCDDYVNGVQAYNNYNQPLFESLDIQCSAPTLAQAHKWLREKGFGLTILRKSYSHKTWYSLIKYPAPKAGVHMTTAGTHVGKSYEETLSNGITECIQFLNKWKNEQ